MSKKILFGFLVLGALNLYADICKTNALTTREEIFRVQKCLKKEIKKSIDVAKSFDSYHSAVLLALKEYSDLKIICKKLEILKKHSKYNKSYYSRKLNEKNKKKRLAKKSLRRLEIQYGYVGGRYSMFKEQITQLELELELIEIDYATILRR